MSALGEQISDEERKRTKQREYAKRYAERHPEKVGKWAKENPERRRETMKVWRAKNKERINTQSREWKSANPDKVRDGTLRYNFGLSLAEWEAIFAAQGRRCGNPGCRAAEPGHKYGWHTDHDHSLYERTGEIKIRGILCHGCNTGLGQFREDPARLQGAIDYLNKFKCDEAA